MGELCNVACQLAIDTAEDVKTLRRIVYEGNGSPSLVSRMTTLEKSMSALEGMTKAILVCVLGIFGTVVATLLVNFFSRR